MDDRNAIDTEQKLFLGCYDCGRGYGEEFGFPDLIVPNDVWSKISPTGDEGGMLCPSCMCKRAHNLGIECHAVFRSGPFFDHDDKAIKLASENARMFAKTDSAGPPDGYEIVDREKEPDDARVGDDWIFYIHDQERWCSSRSIGEFLYLIPSETIYARPIRKRTLWVPARERQPPVEKRVPIKSEVAGYLGYVTVDASGNWFQNGRLYINDSLGCKLWLDLDAAEAIEAERDRLAAQCDEHTARITELEAENNLLRRERDALVDALCRHGEWFRGLIDGLISK